MSLKCQKDTFTRYARNILTVIGTYAFSNLYSHETLERRENSSERETTEEVKEGCQRM